MFALIVNVTVFTVENNRRCFFVSMVLAKKSLDSIIVTVGAGLAASHGIARKC